MSQSCLRIWFSALAISFRAPGAAIFAAACFGLG